MGNLVYSRSLVAGTLENVNHVQDMFQDVTSYVNNGAISDSNLTSPNNSPWRTVMMQSVYCQLLTAVGTNVFQFAATPPGSGVDYFTPLLQFRVPADIAVTGLTTQMRIKAAIATNATAPGVTLTFGVTGIAGASGTGNNLNFTMGSNIATVAFVTPAANSTVRGQGTAITMPLGTSGAAGTYCLTVTSSGSQAANSIVGATVTVEMRHV